jgi:hypothetical protein
MGPEEVMDDIERPACPDCGNRLDYAVKLASIEHKCRYCNRAHWFSFDGIVRLVDTLNSEEALP